MASTCVASAAPASATRATEWRPVIYDLEDFPGYWINAKGEVLSSRRSKKPRLLRPTTVKSGHLRFRLTDLWGEAHNIYAHRLVAFTYHGFPPPGRPYACHIDGNPANNCPANIYWGSPQDNANDKIRHGTCRAVLTEAKAKSVLRRLATGESQSQIARDLQVSRQLINHLATGKTWRHLPRSAPVKSGKTWGWLDHAS